MTDVGPVAGRGLRPGATTSAVLAALVAASALTGCGGRRGNRIDDSDATPPRTAAAVPAAVAVARWHLSTRTFQRVVAAADRTGTRLAMASGNEVVLVDPATNAILSRLTGHSGPVTNLAFSPDGTRLVSAGPDGRPRVWDAATGTRVSDFAGHRDRIESVAWFADGRRLVSSDLRGDIAIWDGADGRMLTELIADGPLWGTPSPPRPSADGTSVVGATERHVVVWDSTTGNVRARRAVQGSPGPLAVAPNGSVVAFAEGSRVRLLDGSDLSDLAGSENVDVGDDVTDLAWSTDATMLLASSVARVVALDRHAKRRFELPGGAGSWSPDGSKILRLSARHGAMYTASGTEIGWFDGYADTSAWVGNDSVVVGPEPLTRWSVDANAVPVPDRRSTEAAPLRATGPTGRPVAPILSTTAPLDRTTKILRLSPDGRFLALFGDDRFTICDFADIEHPRYSSTLGSGIRDVAFVGPRTMWVLRATGIDVADLSSASIRRTIRGTFDDDANLMPSPDTSLVAVWDSSSLGIYDAEGTKVRSGPAVSGLRWSPDSATVLTTRQSEMAVVRVRSGSSRRLPGAVTNTPGSWSADGHRFFAVPVTVDTERRTTHPAPALFDSTTLKRTARVEGHTGELTASAWTRDGTILATASTDGTVLLRNPATGSVGGTLRHSGIVESVAFDDSGRFVLTVSMDSWQPFARVWDASTATPVLTVPFAAAAEWVPGSTRIATVGTERFVGEPALQIWAVR